ncbi:uncharacterized protein DUF4358 [Mobilisporobacter senegalensis]|uniref:Uncharacterized protein DUF4358 n=1 Tax=Mobilisporobacter senegalensis TaxID=1329262 RepID=A0A3N1XXP3_9FIRM|nr:DUF4358 domain-containing protein [Mobilisporobacter senegalensis]ROR31393.1 uncharacterized protein DUF4358 [Mobilisporobacter senegalensis]
MNRYKLVVISLIFSMCFTACSTKPKEPKVKVADLMDQITDKVAKDYKISNEEQLGYKRLDFLEEDSKDIISTINLKKDTIEEGFYLADATGKTSDRIMIAKAKKDTDIKGIADAFRKMKETQDKEWKKKQKTEYKKVKDALVVTKNKYVYYIVYDDMESINKIISDGIVNSKKS